MDKVKYGSPQADLMIEELVGQARVGLAQAPELTLEQQRDLQGLRLEDLVERIVATNLGITLGAIADELPLVLTVPPHRVGMEGIIRHWLRLRFQVEDKERLN